jgi:hypothetical protein
MADTGTPSHPLRIFLCHSSEDKPAVRELYQRLRTDGFEPWLDEEDLLPGQDWHAETLGAVRNSDVVIVCLSQDAIGKAGHVQKEIKVALDVADEQPEGAIFVIPLKIEECRVPERLSHLQSVNYFAENGHAKLSKALLNRAKALGLRVGLLQESGPLSQPTETSSQYQVVNQSGGVSLEANNVTVGQDVVGRDKIINFHVEAGATVIVDQAGGAIWQPDIAARLDESVVDNPTGTDEELKHAEQ